MLEARAVLVWLLIERLLRLRRECARHEGLLLLRLRRKRVRVVRGLGCRGGGRSVLLHAGRPDRLAAVRGDECYNQESDRVGHDWSR